MEHLPLRDGLLRYRVTESKLSLFDFTHHMTRLCHELTCRVNALAHIDMNHVLVAATFNRKQTSYGVYADITPLRFAGGHLVGSSRGQQMKMPRIVDARGREQLYIVTFFLPRFLRITGRERLEVVVHELWHVAPEFDGSLRRFPGPHRVHGPTPQAYDEQVSRLAGHFLKSAPSAESLAFLELSWDEIVVQYRRVGVQRMRRPRMTAVG